jgi:hypothetical protein
MMIPNMAKNAITMKKDMLVRSRAPHVPFLMRFFELTELFDFFGASFEYILDSRVGKFQRPLIVFSPRLTAHEWETRPRELS